MSQPNTTKQIAKERGGRIRLARQLINFTKKQVAEKYNISYHTLHAWEMGSNCISEEKASKLADIFKSEGLNASKEWILTGDTQNYFNLDQSKLKDTINLTEDIKIFNEIEYFNQTAPGSIVTPVTDQALSPIFAKGDYVGGIILDKNNYKDVEGSFCIIILNDNKITTRKIISISQEEAFICSINPLAKIDSPHSENVFFKNIALITRHWLIGSKS